MPYQLTIETLEDGWQDRDYIMLHACFQCLIDCVEKENLLRDNRDWAHNNETQAAHEELASLYAWWKAKMAANETHSGMSDAEDESYKLDSAMLLRLLSVRRYLWT